MREEIGEDGIANNDESEIGSFDDSVGVWLREVGKTPLLTADEEISLAKRIRAGDNDAKQALICANLRLVVMLVSPSVIVAVGCPFLT